MRNHALAPNEGVATVMTRTVKQFAEVHVKVAQESIEAIHVTECNAQVATVFTRPRFKRKHLAVAQARAQSLTRLQVLMRHGAQGGEAQHVSKVNIAGAGKLAIGARAQTTNEHAQDFFMPCTRETSACTVVGNFQRLQIIGLKLFDFGVES